MTQHLTAEALRKDFLAVFGQEADQTFFSPGRINLIGEHTDYNGGHVFPAAILWGHTERLASVTTKSCVSTQPILKTRVSSKCLLLTSSLKKSTAGPTIQKGFFISCRSWSCD